MASFRVVKGDDHGSCPDTSRLPKGSRPQNDVEYKVCPCAYKKGHVEKMYGFMLRDLRRDERDWVRMLSEACSAAML